MESIIQMEKLYLDILNNLRDGIYFVDTQRKILFWNKGAEEITGHSAADIMGAHCPQSMLNHVDEDGRPLCMVGCPLFATLSDGESRKAHVLVRHKDGYRIPVYVNVFPIRRENEIIGAVEIFTQTSPTVYDNDIVERLTDIAMHDALTRLPNRRYLESFLKYRMEKYQRFGQLFAVLFADIDDFSSFNNSYGHDTGDAVLKNISESIRRSVRRNDLVGRWGGEEFLGVYPIAKPEDAAVIGEKFRRLVQNTEVVSAGQSLKLSVSVGVTSVRNGDTIESIIERADSLMYRSKHAGKNRVSAEC